MINSIFYHFVTRAVKNVSISQFSLDATLFFLSNIVHISAQLEINTTG